ncbi:HAD hydrolase family protein, partial [Streptococcus pyogenes]
TGFMPESIKKVFSALKAKGIVTGLASGRALYGVVPEIRALEPDYYVTINGAYVVDKKGQEIYTDALPKEVIEKYVTWCH